MCFNQLQKIIGLIQLRVNEFPFPYTVLVISNPSAMYEEEFALDEEELEGEVGDASDDEEEDDSEDEDL